jgi:hypothetical protein
LPSEVGHQLSLGQIVAAVRVAGRAQMPAAPVTFREHAAMPETIEAEYLAASPRAPEPDVAQGVAATLEWTWRDAASSSARR